MTQPQWCISPDGSVYTRSDGATVTRVKTKTGKRPWAGSYWHVGQWQSRSSGHNVKTAQTAMDNIDYHWPNAMIGKTTPPP